MQKIKIFLPIIFLVMALAACSSPTPAPLPTQENAPAAVVEQPVALATVPQPTVQAGVSGPIEGKALTIILPDGSGIGYTVQELDDLLNEVKVDLYSSQFQGFRISDILVITGVTNFIEITLQGSANPVTLQAAQVDENTILDLNAKGGYKLATPNVEKDQWTRDVNLIIVK